VSVTYRTRELPEARCPVRPGDPCSLCQPGATGPQDCGLVYLVMSDDELRAGLRRNRLERATRAYGAGTAAV
jgi:hypothetical protein